MAKLAKIFQALVTVIVLFGTIVALSPEKASAKTIGDVNPKIIITDEQGKVLSENKIGQWQSLKIRITFDLPNNKVKKGDTTTITLPNQLHFTTTDGFELRDKTRDKVVATANVDAKTKTVKLIYTDYAENYSDVKGELFFYARVDHIKYPKEQDMPLNFGVEGKVVPGGEFHYKEFGTKL